MAFSPKLLQQGAAGSGGPKNYIEDVFSTYLYTGTGTSRFIQNNMSLGYAALPAQASFGTGSGNLQNVGNVSDFFSTPTGGAFIGGPNGYNNPGYSTGYEAGKNIVIDFGSAVTVNLCTYRNTLPQSAGSSWAPAEVWLQSSPDNSTWTVRKSYSDATGSEAINGAIQYITYDGTATARYWRMYQATDTRGGSTGYNWGFGDFAMYTNGDGGLLWIKNRDSGNNHILQHTPSH
jgi:hypothetical protein